MLTVIFECLAHVGSHDMSSDWVGFSHVGIPTGHVSHGLLAAGLTMECSREKRRCGEVLSHHQCAGGGSENQSQRVPWGWPAWLGPETLQRVPRPATMALGTQESRQRVPSWQPAVDPAACSPPSGTLLRSWLSLKSAPG